MTRRSPEELLQHITSESSRFREVLATTSPEAPVPACPDWAAEDLLWHLGEVQGAWSWATEQSVTFTLRRQAHEALTRAGATVRVAVSVLDT